MRKKKNTPTGVIPVPCPPPSPELLLKVARELYPQLTDEEIFERVVYDMRVAYGKPEHPGWETRKILIRIARIRAMGEKGAVSRAVRNLYGITNTDPRFKKLYHAATMACKRYPKTLAAFIRIMS